MTQPENQIFASNIKAERLRRRKTQEQFAKFLGVKRSRLGAWEEGRAVPRFDAMGLITEKLNIQSIDLLIMHPQKFKRRKDGISEIELKYQWLTDEKRAIVDMILNQ